MKAKNVFFILLLIFFLADTLPAQQTQRFPLPQIGITVADSDEPQDVALTLQILILLTILSLAPSIIIMTTSYLRIIIVFHFLRQAMGTMQQPPNQLMAGIALFITFFVMSNTWERVYDEALVPMMNEEISMDSAWVKGVEPLREFMFAHTRDEDIALFLSLTTDEMPETREDLDTFVLIPGFILSELRAGFMIGFFIYLPFLIIDLVIASILMAMGMMMLPPVMISLPFKILLFILVDGWNLVIGSLIRGFM